MNLVDKGFLLHFKESTLKFKIRKTDIAERWYQELLLAIERSDFCEKDRIYNFGESIEDVMNDLLYSARVINSWQSIIDLSKTDMNHLHKYFEIMRGSSENPAQYYLNAPEDIKLHIERYNILIHKIEVLEANIKKIVVRSKGRKRFDLLPDDYNYFTTKVKFGTVYINYCHVGKPLYDLFKDEDEIVGDHNIVPQSKYSSDMCIFFSDMHYQVTDFFDWFDRKSNWLNSLGFHKDDPKIALGMIPIADLVISTDRQTVLDMISCHKKYDTVTAW